MERRVSQERQEPLANRDSLDNRVLLGKQVLKEIEAKSVKEVPQGKPDRTDNQVLRVRLDLQAPQVCAPSNARTNNTSYSSSSFNLRRLQIWLVCLSLRANS